MNTSPSIDLIAVALGKAQAALKPAEKSGRNPHLKSKYSTLADVWAACKEALLKNDLTIAQTTDFDEKNILIVETLLMHKSGQWIVGRTSMNPAKIDPQAFGSAITYGRRYGLAAIVGVCPEDDDAVASSAPAASTKPLATIEQLEEWDHKYKISESMEDVKATDEEIKRVEMGNADTVKLRNLRADAVKRIKGANAESK